MLMLKKKKTKLSTIKVTTIDEKVDNFLSSQKVFKLKDKGIYIRLFFENMSPGEYEFGLRTIKPNVESELFTLTQEYKEKDIGGGLFSLNVVGRYWKYSFEKDNLSKFFGEWKTEFLLNGKKLGETFLLLNKPLKNLVRKILINML